jgi:hypothetical protein
MNFLTIITFFAETCKNMLKDESTKSFGNDEKKDYVVVNINDEPCKSLDDEPYEPIEVIERECSDLICTFV